MVVVWLWKMVVWLCKWLWWAPDGFTIHVGDLEQPREVQLCMCVCDCVASLLLVQIEYWFCDLNFGLVCLLQILTRQSRLGLYGYFYPLYVTRTRVVLF